MGSFLLTRELVVLEFLLIDELSEVDELLEGVLVLLKVDRR